MHNQKKILLIEIKFSNLVIFLNKENKLILIFKVIIFLKINYKR